MSLGDGPHVETRGLRVSLAGHPVLKGIDCTIPRGEITVILGPSGCGKTTLLRSLNRLVGEHDEALVEGQILLDGLDCYAAMEPMDLRKRVGLLSQRPYPLPMSIYDNVAYGVRLHGLAPERGMDATVERYLRLAGLWDEVKGRLAEPAARLSIGQQQRLCLARGIAVEPEVVLADEPTSALDPISSQAIEGRFRDLRKDYTFVIVTHTLRQAKRLADHVVFLYDGELVEAGAAGDFFAAPRTERAQAFLSGLIG